MSAHAAAPFEDVLASAGDGVRESMAAVERLLDSIAAAYGGALSQAAGQTLSAGGKRLRPLLVFVCGRRSPQDGQSVGLVRAGAAVELIHMATLVHDDVVDDAVLRRGRPTVYAQSGRGLATATGDHLFARAFALLREGNDERQARALSRACLSLARGELVQRRDAYARDVDVARYLRRCELKTASLFTAACELGALAEGRTPQQSRALGRFGRKLGLAFQMLDDVLDVSGPPERTGKERGTDLTEGTVTLPLLLAAQVDPELAELDLRSLRTRAQAERVCDLIAATDALEQTRQRGGELVAEAKAELDCGLDSGTVELLELVADRVVSRYS